MARIIAVTLGALIVAGCGEMLDPAPQERSPVPLFDNGTSDVDPPELTDFSFVPTSVDVTEGAAVVDVTISATDAGVGVGGVNPNFVSPSSGQGTSCVANTPSSGTANDGTWTCQITIPQFSEAGEWHVSGLLLGDFLGNRRVLSEADLIELGHNTRLQVVSPDQDVVAPELTEFSFTPTSVDVSQGAAVVDVTISATDAGVGVGGVNPNFVSPSSGQGTSCVANTPSSGTANDGTWTCQITIPQFSEEGEWHVSGLLLGDFLGNRRVLSEADLIELGHNTSLQVVSGGQDAVPPELTGFSFTPTSVDVSQSAVVIDVTISATDAGVGVGGVNPNFVSPSSGQGTSCVANTPSSGTANDGTWTCQITIAQFSEAGEWHVSALLLGDFLGNRRVLSEADLIELDYNTRLMVTNTIPVTIDIMPGSSTNAINLKKKGLIPVAILSTTTFDAASDVDRTTLTFGSTGNEVSWSHCRNEAEDVDGNGSTDLVCYFRSPDTGFKVGDTMGILRGALTSGQPIEGTDAVRVR
jgi:hypothetical protein